MKRQVPAVAAVRGVGGTTNGLSRYRVGIIFQNIGLLVLHVR